VEQFPALISSDSYCVGSILLFLVPRTICARQTIRHHHPLVKFRGPDKSGSQQPVEKAGDEVTSLWLSPQKPNPNGYIF
jgi:hypothetical protein